MHHGGEIYSAIIHQLLLSDWITTDRWPLSAIDEAPSIVSDPLVAIVTEVPAVSTLLIMYWRPIMLAADGRVTVMFVEVALAKMV